MSTTYTIFCAILGEAALFSVKIASDETVDGLKAAIKEKKPNRFADVDADELALYHVDIPYNENVDIVTAVEQKISERPTKLLPTEDLAVVFKDGPKKRTIHIMVQPPKSVETPENRPNSLPTLNLTPEAAQRPDRTAVQTLIDAFVEKELRPKIQRYLESPPIICWSPPEAVTQETRNFYTALKVPLVNGKPNLLLHRLQESPNPNGNLLFNGRPYLIYCAVSGAGKTRVVFECLCGHFGFYFVAARGTDGIGSRDIEAMTALMCDDQRWIQDIFKDRSPQAVVRASTVNEGIATKAMMKVIAARWIVFRIFIEMARTQNGGSLPADIKHDWLLFQVLPGVRINQMDPFLALIDNCLVGADVEVLRSLIGQNGAESILGSEFKQDTDKFFYVLDEVQVLGEQYVGYFSDANGELRRPVLRPFIGTLTSDRSIPVVVSGTGFSLDDFKIVLTSGVGKESNWETEYSTGDFTDPTTQHHYISRYLPPRFLLSPSGRTLLDRMYKWLRGRHRFTARFVEEILRGDWHGADPAAPHKQLNAYINRLAGSTPHDGDNAFVEQEPDAGAINVDTFMWEKIDKKPTLLKDLAHSFYTWITQGKFPLWWIEQRSLVEYGLARFIWTEDPTIAATSANGYRHAVIIQEPLALTSIMNHWHSRGLTLLDNIRTRFQSDQGAAFEEVLVFVLTKLLQNKLELRKIFTFRLTPSWARSTAQLVAKTSSGSLEIFQDHQLSSPSTEIVFRAKDLDDVEHWLQHGQAAWCMPPNAMGPDLMAWVKLTNGEKLLLVIQAKCWFTGNIETLFPDVSAHAIRTTIPAKFFAGSISDNDRQRLTAMLGAINPQTGRYTSGRYNILRVVSAFPLDVNFESRSTDVQSALGEDDHALAKLSNTALVSTLADYAEGSSITSFLAAAVKKARKTEGDGDGDGSPSKRRKLGGENSMVLA